MNLRTFETTQTAGCPGGADGVRPVQHDPGDRALARQDASGICVPHKHDRPCVVQCGYMAVYVCVCVSYGCRHGSKVHASRTLVVCVTDLRSGWVQIVLPTSSTPVTSHGERSLRRAGAAIVTVQSACAGAFYWSLFVFFFSRKNDFMSRLSRCRAKTATLRWRASDLQPHTSVLPESPQRDNAGTGYPFARVPDVLGA